MPCHMMSPEVELAFARRLLDIKGAVLVPEYQVPVSAKRRKIVAGAFSVWSSAVKDRLIIDKRRISATQRRVRRAQWAIGAQLGLIRATDAQRIRGNIIDLKVFFY